jgi:hypothetical protein
MLIKLAQSVATSTAASPLHSWLPLLFIVWLVRHKRHLQRLVRVVAFPQQLQQTVLPTVAGAVEPTDAGGTNAGLYNLTVLLCADTGKVAKMYTTALVPPASVDTTAQHLASCAGADNVASLYTRVHCAARHQHLLAPVHSM